MHPSRNIAVGTHEVYDLASNTWTKAADMPTPRNHAAGGVVQNRIYIIGGRAGSVFIPNAFNVDLVRSTIWQRINGCCARPCPRRRAPTPGVHRGRIYVAGGEIRHPRLLGRIHGSRIV